jgi:hypothetical protein
MSERSDRRALRRWRRRIIAVGLDAHVPTDRTILHAMGMHEARIAFVSVRAWLKRRPGGERKGEEG